MTRLRLVAARRRVAVWNRAVKHAERRLRRAYDRLVDIEHRAA